MNSLNDAIRAATALWAPPPKLDISAWADEFRFLSQQSSAQHGRWKTSRVPYVAGIFQALADPNIQDIVWCSASQTGKTEAVNTWLAYLMAREPCPILMVQPTVQMATAWSRDRLQPMLNDTPVLRGLVKATRSRDGSNTLLYKSFPGGHLTAVGANAPSGLASRPIRAVVCDEVDRFGASAGGEGDAVDLAFRRTVTFFNRKRVIVSTPTIKNASRIELAYENSDKRRYYVPCSHCGALQVLTWAQVKWPKGCPDEAQIECVECKELWSEADRQRAVKHGEWQATAKSKIAGFHLNALYSPWATPADCAVEFIQAKKSVETLRVWTNTVLAESFEEIGQTLGHEHLFARREEYHGAPIGAGTIVAGVDTQDNRLEISIYAVSKDSEIHAVSHHVIWGDPNQDGENSVWKMLDEYLLTPVPHASGYPMKIHAACVDSGGHATGAVYRYCKAKEHRNIFAVKGRAEAGKAVVSRISRSNAGKVALLILGVDGLKSTIFSRLQLTAAGPGYIHFPNSDDFDEEFFKQLTSESLQTSYKNGVPYKSFKRKGRQAAESLDCLVYALAAIELLTTLRKWNLNKRCDAIKVRDIEESPPLQPEEEEEIPLPKPSKKADNWVKRQRAGGWMNRGR